MKYYFTISVLFCVLHFVQSQPLQVCKDCSIYSISDAIKRAAPGDTIHVIQGTYKEFGILIDKPLVLIGENSPVIDGENKGEILTIQADSVVLEGFVIKNVGSSHIKDNSAIHILKSHNFEIRNNVLENVFFGIRIEKSKYGKIINNKVSANFRSEFNSGNGIHIWNSKKMEIRENELFGLRDGIYLEFVDESRIENNSSYNNIRYGLHFMFSNHDDYLGNLFRDNGAGVAVMFSKFITMKDNRFLQNWGAASFGLLLKEIYDAEIENNTFNENTVAVNVEGSTRVNYKNNNFLSNGWAVKITGGCYENVFSQNNFIGNSFDVSYNSNLNDNRFEYNYWSDYSGYDLDRNGVGDVPYRPVKLFSYVVNQTPETIILLRSLFIDILNFSEKVSPIFTPDNLMDSSPQMQPIK